MKKALRIIGLLICLAVAAFSVYKLWDIHKGRSEAKQLYADSSSRYVTVASIPQTSDHSKSGSDAARSSIEAGTEDGQAEQDGDPVQEEPAPIIYAPIAVDFDLLMEENPEIVGWLYCEGTIINYPVYKAENNEKYVHHLPNGRWNNAGTLFMDHKNEADLSDQNTIIYGHAMGNGTMFGSFKEYLSDPAYFTEHPYLWLLTPDGDYRLDIAAIVVVHYSDDIYDVRTAYDDPVIQELLPSYMEASKVDTGIAAEDVGEKIMLLSTCSKTISGGREVLICRYVPCTEKNS